MVTIDAQKSLPKVLDVAEGRRLGDAVMIGHPRLKHRLVPPRDPARVSGL